MIIMIIFLGLSVLLLVATIIYANYKKKSNSQIKDVKTKEKKKGNKNIADVLNIKIKDSIIKIDNRYSSILRLGNIDYNMLSDNEQETIENVLVQTALSIDYPIQFFSTTENIDTTKVINKIKDNKVINTEAAQYKAYLINYLENLMENRNISVIKNYAIISYDGLYTNAIDEISRRINSFKGNLLRAKIQSDLLDENELNNLIFRELNKGSKVKIENNEGGLVLYVNKKSKNRKKEK
ncbi:MAG: hypothetical protein Q4G09_00740 [Clostridia bacterium]|nr:hypothetical protein [Clostridia bacterium]